MERVSTSSADSTCKFPGYFRAASARILENTIADEQIAKEWFLLTSTCVGSWFNKRLRVTAMSERERERRKWVTDFPEIGRTSVQICRSFHVTEANPGKACSATCWVIIMKYPRNMSDRTHYKRIKYSQMVGWLYRKEETI